MKVAVDRSMCQGHNRCNAIAPDIFHLDDLGYAYTDEEEPVAPEQEEQVIRAARACPEQAIRMRRESATETEDV